MGLCFLILLSVVDVSTASRYSISLPLRPSCLCLVAPPVLQFSFSWIDPLGVETFNFYLSQLSLIPKGREELLLLLLLQALAYHTAGLDGLRESLSDILYFLKSP